MLTDQLTGVLEEYKFKKDILDNHTDKIAEGIKDWCIKEYARIRRENDNLRDFFLANKSIVTENMRYYSNTGGWFYWGGYGLTIGGNIPEDWSWSKDCTEFQYVALPCGENVGKRSCDRACGVKWEDLANNKETSIDYWVDLKNALLNYNDNLNEIVKRVKKFLENLVFEQENRCKRMIEAVKDVTKDNISSVTITIRTNN